MSLRNSVFQQDPPSPQFYTDIVLYSSYTVALAIFAFLKCSNFDLQWAWRRIGPKAVTYLFLHRCNLSDCLFTISFC